VTVTSAVSENGGVLNENVGQVQAVNLSSPKDGSDSLHW